MPTMVFLYPEEKIKKLDVLSQGDGRSRSSYIQLILLDYLQKKETKKLKRKD